MSYFRTILPFVAICSLLAITGCNDDEPEQNANLGSVEFSIQGKLDGSDLAIDSKTYNALGAAEGFRLSRLSFFLSDIRLVELSNGQALETELADVAYFNFGPSGVDSEVFDNIPTGNYTSIRFNFGLTAEQDMTTPADYATTHPLGNTAEYWVDWNSYIFAKIEGKTDTMPDSIERFDGSFVFHVGVAADNTRPGEVAINLPLEAGMNDLSLDLDVATLMQLNTSSELPLTEFIHRGPLMGQISNSAISAFSVAQ